LETTRLSEELCDAAHTELVTQGRVRRTQQDDEASYESHSFDMPLGSTQGWEAIVPVVADLGQYVQCESASPTETS
jgi:hypothetical protein